MQGSRAKVRVDWASHEAAKHACFNWHYSKTMPMPPNVFIGAWEDDRFIGVLIFSRGANKSLGAPYGLSMLECCELTRVALRDHVTPVTKIKALAIKMLRKQSPGLRLIVSFADPVAGHHGGIYQGGNWIYAGLSSKSFEYLVDGKRVNKRAFTGKNFGGGKASIPRNAVKVEVPGKHRYLMPLDAEMRARVASLSQPFPKRLKQAMAASSSTAAGQH